MLLRVPGIGVKSAQRIRGGRGAAGSWTFADLKRIGVVLKRAQVFHHLQRLFPWRDCRAGGHRARPARAPAAFGVGTEQLSLFAAPAVQELAAQGMRPGVGRAGSM